MREMSRMEESGMKLPGPTPSALTNRELEVLALLAKGNANKEVASILSISVRTVEWHRSQVMHKLNLQSMSALVRFAIRNKIVEL